MRPSVNRRQFLAATGSLAFAAPLTAFGERLSGGRLFARAGDGYGVIRPAADGATGLHLLELPEGFRYVSFSWRGDRLDDGRVTPGAHDGMAAFAAPGGRIRLIRNHEVDLDTGTFGSAPAYDAGASGGTTTVEFDPVIRRVRQGVGEPVWHRAQLRGRAHAVGFMAHLRGDAG